MDVEALSIDEGQKADQEEPPSPLERGRLINQYKFIKGFIKWQDFASVTAEYPFVSTAYYLSLIKQAPGDPILRQLCPSHEELNHQPGEAKDPLAEEKNSPVPGLIHRYPDRVLMIVTNSCFMNCRHCTRKRLWKNGRGVIRLADIGCMIDYIAANKKVRDVIISGGDPLTLTSGFLDHILEKVRSISHVEIIRIGTRAPVVHPLRINDALIRVLKKHRPLWLNTQFNHANEITPQSAGAVQKILEAGIPVNNQSVLLKGVNDDAETLTQLCHGLLKIGVRPYYLFHCDPVEGVSHFRTSIEKGIEIIEKMRGHTSGLAVPTYVVDAVDGGGKIPLQPDYMRREGDTVILRNYAGCQFEYSFT